MLNCKIRKTENVSFLTFFQFRKIIFFFIFVGTSLSNGMVQNTSLSFLYSRNQRKKPQNCNRVLLFHTIATLQRSLVILKNFGMEQSAKQVQSLIDQISGGKSPKIVKKLFLYGFNKSLEEHLEQMGNQYLSGEFLAKLPYHVIGKTTAICFTHFSVDFLFSFRSATPHTGIATLPGKPKLPGFPSSLSSSSLLSKKRTIRPSADSQDSDNDSIKILHTDDDSKTEVHKSSKTSSHILKKPKDISLSDQPMVQKPVDLDGWNQHFLQIIIDFIFKMGLH